MFTLNLTLNFACMAACLRFHKGEFQILTVFYYDDKSMTYQLRLPGGTVKFEDLYNAIENCMPSFPKEYHQRFKFVVEKIKDYEKSYNEFLTPEIKKDQFSKNTFFNNYIRNIYLLIENSGPEDLLVKISEEARLIALLREVGEEAQGSLKGKLYKFSSSFSGPHEKLGFMTFDMLAPDSWKGSPDKDIECSQWMSVEKAIQQLFDSNGSSHKVLAQSAIKMAIDLKLHPRIEELRIYSGENN